MREAQVREDGGNEQRVRGPGSVLGKGGGILPVFFLVKGWWIPVGGQKSAEQSDKGDRTKPCTSEVSLPQEHPKASAAEDRSHPQGHLGPSLPAPRQINE